VRIVGGRHRGRRLEAPAGDAVRPTSDRARQALFDVLAHAAWAPALEGARVLDAFCGTGALGIEALSRGAAHAHFLDSARASLDATRRNLAALGEEAAATVIRADATRPPPAPGPCTLAFLDPPYGKGLGGRAVPALAAAGWFAPGAVIVLEDRAGEPPPDVPGFEPLDRRVWGEAGVTVLRAP
jgi:16S rRNA (guanine966-N2)-methyltransferase